MCLSNLLIRACRLFIHLGKSVLFLKYIDWMWQQNHENDDRFLSIDIGSKQPFNLHSTARMIRSSNISTLNGVQYQNIQTPNINTSIISLRKYKILEKLDRGNNNFSVIVKSSLSLLLNYGEAKVKTFLRFATLFVNFSDLECF